MEGYFCHPGVYDRPQEELKCKVFLNVLDLVLLSFGVAPRLLVVVLQHLHCKISGPLGRPGFPEGLEKDGVDEAALMRILPQLCCGASLSFSSWLHEQTP